MVERERCVNLDWLEVYCIEPSDCPHSAEYFRKSGFFVHERDYGTRIYHEMFTLCDKFGYPMIEIRRSPKSTIDKGGILDPCGTHIRLVNRYCYLNQAAYHLKQFLESHHYTDIRVSRVDVALDFELFDTGDIPQKFIQRYMAGRYSKINQANIHSHGSDRWDGRTWNSIKWGAPKSQISTKFYLKTLELKEVKDKPYIRQAWFESHLVDNPVTLQKFRPDGTVYEPLIWRVEFSITSSVKGWYTIERDGKQGQYHSFRNNLAVYRDRESIWKVWSSLCQHYFHFKKYEKDKRKDYCEDKVLFHFGDKSTFYHVERVAVEKQFTDHLRSLEAKLKSYRECHAETRLRECIDYILTAIRDEQIRDDLGAPFSRDEIRALQLAITGRRPPAFFAKLLQEHSDDLF